MDPLTHERAGSSLLAARPTRQESYEAGRSRRKALARSAHAELTVPAADRDPLAILAHQDETRLSDLVPIRYGRMVPTPFTFLRGAAAVMAHDLAASPHTGLVVQLCGDAHLSNFGAYAGPDRRLVFDLNDFDETLPGPFEWDLKRLTASLVVAARDNGFPGDAGPAAAAEAVRSYREAITHFASIPMMDTWYQRMEAESIMDMAGESADVHQRVERAVKKASRRTSLQAFEKLTAVVDGRRRIVADPPLVVPLEEDELPGITRRVSAAFEEYRTSLAGDRRHLLDRFRYVDLARKIVGVGSVGTRCLILLLEDDSGAPLFLQAKEADRSVLEAHLPASRYRNHGRRVVEGQRLMQATSDIFLGWSHDAEGEVDFYFRQLRDMKYSGDIASLIPETFLRYAALCGAVMARAHARSGDAAAISGYVGKGGTFDSAISSWAVAYADQTERDHEMLVEAVADGRVDAVRGV
ncbi:MAG: DUF2252 domain-containing protein [Acidimicrobiia bacterium]|nr:DUF2252 domain-containing protein [Acidimicrobiia bacterium]